MTIQTLRRAIAAGLLALAAQPAGAEITTVTPERTDRLPVDLLADIQFASNDHGFKRDELYLDLLRPITDAPVPVVVFVLGSGWSPVEAERVLPQLTFLAQAGFAVASIDYRGIGEAPFPAAQQDAKRAIRFLRANGAAYGLDPGAIGVMGNSAGGHIALLAGLGADDAFAEEGAASGGDSGVRAIAAIYPAIYLREMASDPLGPVNAHLGMMAGDEENAEAVADALPETHLDAGDPPVLLIHGTADPVVPVDQSERFHDALDAAGIDATLLRVDGLGHSIEDMLTTRQVAETLVDFFDRTLRAPDRD